MSVVDCTCGGRAEVYETRVDPESGFLRRRRRCRNCGAGWTTYEVRGVIRPGNQMTEAPILAEPALTALERDVLDAIRRNVR